MPVPHTMKAVNVFHVHEKIIIYYCAGILALFNSSGVFQSPPYMITKQRTQFNFVWLIAVFFLNGNIEKPITWPLLKMITMQPTLFNFEWLSTVSLSMEVLKNL